MSVAAAVIGAATSVVGTVIGAKGASDDAKARARASERQAEAERLRMEAEAQALERQKQYDIEKAALEEEALDLEDTALKRRQEIEKKALERRYAALKRTHDAEIGALGRSVGDLRQELMFEQERLDFDLGNLRRSTDELIGVQQASFAASGFDPSFGSSAAVVQDTQVQSQREATMLRRASAIVQSRIQRGIREAEIEQEFRTREFAIATAETEEDRGLLEQEYAAFQAEADIERRAFNRRINVMETEYDIAIRETREIGALNIESRLAEAKAYSRQSRMAGIAGGISAVGSILGTTAKYKAYKDTGNIGYLIS